MTNKKHEVIVKEPSAKAMVKGIENLGVHKWRANEMNLFFAVLYKLKFQETNEIVLSSHDLNAVLTTKNKTATRDRLYLLKKDVISFMDRAIGSFYREGNPNDDGGNYKVYGVFQKLDLEWNDDKSDFSLTVSLSEDFKHLVDTKQEFLFFALEDFVDIKNKYSKAMYLKLKQWHSKGAYMGYNGGGTPNIYKLDDVKRDLDVPKSYTAHQIDTRVMDKVRKDLSFFFEDLDITAIHDRKNNNKLVGYTITFRPQRLIHESQKNKNVQKTEQKVYNKTNKSYSKKPNRVESTPEWFGKKYTETPLDPKEEQRLQQQIAKIRKGK